ncbi:MAG: hypothetical protein PVI43_00465 [Candidatus Bathyarchaeota archaeon]|jgi:hypothetical protein
MNQDYSVNLTAQIETNIAENNTAVATISLETVVTARDCRDAADEASKIIINKVIAADFQRYIITHLDIVPVNER